MRRDNALLSHRLRPQLHVTLRRPTPHRRRPLPPTSRHHWPLGSKKCPIIAKFHYTGPTGPARTRTDPNDPDRRETPLVRAGLRQCPCGSGRASVVEFSLNETHSLLHHWRRQPRPRLKGSEKCTTKDEILLGRIACTQCVDARCGVLLQMLQCGLHICLSVCLSGCVSAGHIHELWC